MMDFAYQTKDFKFYLIGDRKSLKVLCVIIRTVF